MQVPPASSSPGLKYSEGASRREATGDVDRAATLHCHNLEIRCYDLHPELVVFGATLIVGVDHQSVTPCGAGATAGVFERDTGMSGAALNDRYSLLRAWRGWT